MPAGRFVNFLYQYIPMFIQNSGTDATNLYVCLYYVVTTVEKYGLVTTMAKKQHRLSDNQITLLEWLESFISNCSKKKRGAKYQKLPTL